MVAENQHEMLLRRVPSHVAGLDAVLNGGFFCGGIYLIAGEPGSGKTILGNQICFNHVAAGGRAIYLTLLTESHGRMLAALQSMAFFNPVPLGTAFQYLSGYHVLETEGLEGLLRLLRKELREKQVTVLVIDGMVMAGIGAESELILKKFIQDLQVLLELVGCTAFMLTGTSGGSASYPQRTMVDGLLQLTTFRCGMRTIRELQVTKHRGSDHILGSNLYDISDAGVTVYPRAEARLDKVVEASEELSRIRLNTGLPRLDNMLGGGVYAGTTTLLLGSTGSGKTLLGLNFLLADGLSTGPALYLGSFEGPIRLMAKARDTGLNLQGAIDQKHVEIVWVPGREQSVDALLSVLLKTIVARGVRRLFIDSVSTLRQAIIEPGRNATLFTTLGHELRALGVTTMISTDHCEEQDIGALTGMADNIIRLRSALGRTHAHRLVSVMKSRDSWHDDHARTFSITEKGFDIAASSQGADVLLAELSAQGTTCSSEAEK